MMGFGHAQAFFASDVEDKSKRAFEIDVNGTITHNILVINNKHGADNNLNTCGKSKEIMKSYDPWVHQFRVLVVRE
jgi:hypothetical protein